MMSNNFRLFDTEVVIDSATGQLQIGGIEVGDTGWRDIEGDLETGWSGGARLRRTGNVVSLSFSAVNYSSGGNQNCYNVPSGFHTHRTIGFPAQTGLNDSTSVAFVNYIEVRAGGDNYIQTTATATPRYSEMTWLTDDAWPSSLPGTAV